MRVARRRFLGTGAGLASLGALPACSMAMSLTPEQAEGPFYPLTLPLDHDNDLTQSKGELSEPPVGSSILEGKF